jgi:hypothetical protein
MTITSSRTPQTQDPPHTITAFLHIVAKLCSFCCSLYHLQCLIMRYFILNANYHLCFTIRSLMHALFTKGPSGNFGVVFLVENSGKSFLSGRVQPFGDRPKIYHRITKSDPMFDEVPNSFRRSRWGLQFGSPGYLARFFWYVYQYGDLKWISKVSKNHTRQAGPACLPTGSGTEDLTPGTLVATASGDRRQDSDEDSEESDDESYSKRSRLSMISTERLPPIKRLACPFHKHNPEKYMPPIYRACAGFRSTAGVK